MDFEIPEPTKAFLRELDEFIARVIKPLEEENIQFFDYRREWARTPRAARGERPARPGR